MSNCMYKFDKVTCQASPCKASAWESRRSPGLKVQSQRQTPIFGALFYLELNFLYLRDIIYTFPAAFKDTIPAPTGQMREPADRESQSPTATESVRAVLDSNKKLPWCRVCVGVVSAALSSVSRGHPLPPSLHFTFSPCVSSTAAFQWVFGCSHQDC